MVQGWPQKTHKKQKPKCETQELEFLLWCNGLMIQLVFVALLIPRPVQWVKNLVLLQLWCVLHLEPGNFQVWWKKGKKKKIWEPIKDYPIEFCFKVISVFPLIKKFLFFLMLTFLKKVGKLSYRLGTSQMLCA